MSEEKIECSTEEQQQGLVFDPDEAARMLGLTSRQRVFADALLKGCTQAAAAKAAGYSGEGNGLRAAGSKIARSDAVRSYLAWARSEGAGPPDAPADATELKRTLSKHLRSGDRSASIRAAEVLARLEAAEAAERSAASRLMEPDAILEMIAGVGDVWRLWAQCFAKQLGVDWKPKQPVPVGFAEALLNHLEVSPTDAMRQKFYEDLNNHPIPDALNRAASPGNASDRALTGRSIARTNSNGKYHT